MTAVAPAFELDFITAVDQRCDFRIFNNLLHGNPGQESIQPVPPRRREIQCRSLYRSDAKRIWSLVTS